MAGSHLDYINFQLFLKISENFSNVKAIKCLDFFFTRL